MLLLLLLHLVAVVVLLVDVLVVVLVDVEFLEESAGSNSEASRIVANAENDSDCPAAGHNKTALV